MFNISVRKENTVGFACGPSKKNALDCKIARDHAKRARMRNEKRSAKRVYATEDTEVEKTTVSRRAAPVVLANVRGWWTRGVDLVLADDDEG